MEEGDFATDELEDYMKESVDSLGHKELVDSFVREDLDKGIHEVLDVRMGILHPRLLESSAACIQRQSARLTLANHVAIENYHHRQLRPLLPSSVGSGGGRYVD